MTTERGHPSASRASVTPSPHSLRFPGVSRAGTRAQTRRRFCGSVMVRSAANSASAATGYSRAKRHASGRRLTISSAIGAEIANSSTKRGVGRTAGVSGRERRDHEGSSRSRRLIDDFAQSVIFPQSLDIRRRSHDDAVPQQGQGQTLHIVGNDEVAPAYGGVRAGGRRPSWWPRGGRLLSRWKDGRACPAQWSTI